MLKTSFLNYFTIIYALKLLLSILHDGYPI